MSALLKDENIHGVFPWKVETRPVDTKQGEFTDLYYGCDRSDRIAVCLGCKMPECVNCFDKRKKKPKQNRRRSTVREDRHCQIIKRFKALYELHSDMDKIKQELGISKSTYFRYRKEIILSAEGEHK